MRNSLIGVFVLAFSQPALATTVWRGSGQSHQVDGKSSNPYHLVVNVNSLSPTEEEVTVTVMRGGGKVLKKDTCHVQKLAPTQWTKSCEGGSGAGSITDPVRGLGTDWFQDSSGRTFSTTIVFDGDDSMRLFRTEFEGRKPVRYFSETLNKVTK